ncbi:hypothetical protein [Pontibacter burrus]|uniref:Uncharacterized protein n=1 Tax=Pontibacter burrus TaxID=2704466 RepID=A0A6B3LPQ4_9BACT|nr:hypothetical protein [Pontibacter burrus]NEM96146.1 hypothetical protein [Pontibacter burrus]
MPRSQYSPFDRNGEDLVFRDPDFHELAYQIAMGEHTFDLFLTSLGWHLVYTTAEYELEVLLEYGPELQGYGTITRKARPKQDRL